MTTRKLLKKLKSKEYEIKQSSLAQIAKDKVTYKQCRRYACENIAMSLTHIPRSNSLSIEIPRGTDFHFIGRVDTNSSNANDPNTYYDTFEQRDFIAFSIISRRNISHYRGAPFFVYNIVAEDIAHIFPIDSCTEKDARSENKLTRVPSLWLTLDDLDKLTAEFRVYNQITCRTKRRGKIIKPVGIISFSEDDEEKTLEIARRFQIKHIKVHPDEGAINYGSDLLYDKDRLVEISSKMWERFRIPVDKLFFEV